MQLWPLIPEPLDAYPTTERPGVLKEPAFLGHGLLSPFQRDAKNDFAHGGGVRLVQSAVEQVLGTVCSSETTQGELPWRPEFGSLIHRLRHSNNDDILADLARVHSVDALARWEPRVRVRKVTIERAPLSGPYTLNAQIVRVHYRIVSSNVGGVIVPEEGEAAVLISAD